MIIHILSLLIATLLLVGCESTDDSVDTYSYERDSYNWDETYEIDNTILSYERDINNWDETHEIDSSILIRYDITSDGVEEYIIISRADTDFYSESIQIFDGATSTACQITDAGQFIDANISTNLESWDMRNNPAIKSVRDFTLNDESFHINVTFDSSTFYPEIQYGITNIYSIAYGKLVLNTLCYVSPYEVSGYLSVTYGYSDGVFSAVQVSFHELPHKILYRSSPVDSSEAITDGDFVYKYYKSGLKVTEYHGTDTIIRIPDEYNGLPIICVSTGCFSSSDIRAVIMPSVLEISSGAFEFCDYLTTVYAPNTILIGSYAFSSCNSLEAVSFENAVFVDTRAFDTCSNMKSINLPKVKYIGYQAFYNVAVTDIYLPEALVVGSQAFAACFDLKRIYLPSAVNLDADIFFSCGEIELYTVEENLAVKEYVESYRNKEDLKLVAVFQSIINDGACN